MRAGTNETTRCDIYSMCSIIGASVNLENNSARLAKARCQTNLSDRDCARPLAIGTVGFVFANGETVPAPRAPCPAPCRFNRAVKICYTIRGVQNTPNLSKYKGQFKFAARKRR